MKCINFDQHFSDHLLRWMEENRDRFEYAEDMEKAMPDVYDLFLDTPQDFLDGEKPGEYFEKFSDAAMLVSWMQDYLLEGVEVPDMLLNRIADLGDSAVAPLMAVLQGIDSLEEEKMLAVTLLREIGSDAPLDTFICWLRDGRESPDVRDNALESLEGMGGRAVQPMLDALAEAGDEGREAFLSVLSRYPGDDRIFDGLVDLFVRLKDRRAVVAAYLGRLMDARALPLLTEAAASEETPYFDYIEMRAAIEQLGGEAPEREFDEDPAYLEALGKEL